MKRKDVTNQKGEECPVHGTSECGPKFKGGDGGKMGPDKNYVKPMGEEVSEAVRIPSKTGNIILVGFSWRGKFYMIKCSSHPSKFLEEMKYRINLIKYILVLKIRNYEVSDYVPGNPLLHTEDWQKSQVRIQKEV